MRFAYGEYAEAISSCQSNIRRTCAIEMPKPRRIEIFLRSSEITVLNPTIRGELGRGAARDNSPGTEHIGAIS
jgi:hypothetical protein